MQDLKEKLKTLYAQWVICFIANKMVYFIKLNFVQATNFNLFIFSDYHSFQAIILVDLFIQQYKINLNYLILLIHILLTQKISLSLILL